jgi:hypothetical protein
MDCLASSSYFEEVRGLERWVSRGHTLSRGLTILQVKTEVFLEQAKNSMIVDGRAMPDTLASICSTSSAPAVRFARMLGEIDAIAAKREYESPAAK